VTSGTTHKPVRVGVVGAGQAGLQHLDALANCPYAVAVAVYDTDATRLARAVGDRVGQDAPQLTASSSLASLLADPRVELVALATPPDTHLELAMQVLAAGRGLLLEKPPLLTSAELSAVLAEADSRGLPAGVMLQHRFRLPVAATSGSWSPAAVAVIEVVRYRPPAHYARDAWRTDPKASGGALIAHLGVHFLDLACQLLGVPSGITGAVDAIPGTELDQRVAITAEFGQGARLSFIGTTAVDQRAERLAVYDSRRSLIVQGAITSYAAEGGSEDFTAGTSGLRGRVYSDVALAVREHRQPRVASLHSATGVVRLLEMIARLPASGGRP
jgi:predicted dehydrogenase